MKKPNLLFIGIDSLRADYMSLYGHRRLTTPHMDRYLADGGIVFERCFSPSIPTTSGYASMLTGMDCFSTNVVALRHKGSIAPGVATLSEVLRENGYSTTCVGFPGNPASRGFDLFVVFVGWHPGGVGFAHKAENLNQVAIPELERLAGEDRPFFLFLRHMDPHTPYLPPEPFNRIFYQGDETDPDNRSLDPVYAFKPFCDYFASWFPEGCTDERRIDALYAGAVAYMDACIRQLLEKLKELGREEDTVVVFTSDHGETLYDHECWYDHHGLYDCTLHVPFAIRYAGKTKTARIADYCQLKDVMPTVLDVMGIGTDISFDGRDLMKRVRGEPLAQECEIYITECTWMRKHGWRTPQWKLIVALEPDFHFKPEVELYDLIKDPKELDDVAAANPETVAYLRNRMEAHIARRTAATRRQNPMETNPDWHGKGCGPFTTSQQAYDTLHIGDPEAARKLQAGNKP
jgi:arylsulfatase A-like enzyme